jgi:hypothetical protein
MNSVFNEQPTRKITQEFIDGSVSEASHNYGVGMNLQYVYRKLYIYLKSV